jgi:hypothetical protein
MAEQKDQTVANRGPAKSPAKMTLADLNALATRAEQGDRKALPELRDASNCADYPNWSEWFRDIMGNPANWLRDSLGRADGGQKHFAVIAASEATVDKLRRELEGPDPTPIQRLLAERAALCWYTVNL